MESIWENNIKKIKFDSLNGNTNTDVLIIGGGITGILCAYKLKTAGVDCMLVEAKEICCGITKNTTAKTWCVTNSFHTNGQEYLIFIPRFMYTSMLPDILQPLPCPGKSWKRENPR